MTHFLTHVFDKIVFKIHLSGSEKFHTHMYMWKWHDSWAWNCNTFISYNFFLAMMEAFHVHFRLETIKESHKKFEIEFVKNCHLPNLIELPAYGYFSLISRPLFLYSFHNKITMSICVFMCWHDRFDFFQLRWFCNSWGFK